MHVNALQGSRLHWDGGTMLIGGVFSNPGSCISIFIIDGLACMDSQKYVLQMRNTMVTTSVSTLRPCSAASCGIGIASQLRS